MMENRKETKIFGQSSNLIVGLAVLIIFVIGLFWLANAIFSLLYSYWVSGLILIAALVIDHKVVINYGKWLIRLLRNNTPYGLVATLGTAVGYPFVASFLLLKALTKKRLSEAKKAQKSDGEYIDFEEINSDPLDLPEMRKAMDNTDDIFESK